MTPRPEEAAAPRATPLSRARLGAGALPLVVLLGVLAPLAIHWLAGETLVWFDSQREYAPQRWLVDEALRSFRLPLWNPYMAAGMPLFAGLIHGVLHPISLLAAWLGGGRSLDLMIGAYVAAAGLGAALLARELGASRTASALAGVAYGSSGFVFSMAAFPNLLAGAASLPFCVAGLRRFARAPSPGALALAAGATAVLVFSGDPQALMVAGALALPLGWEAGGWKGALRAVGGGLLGLVLAGIQLVPAVVHVPRTVRAVDAWRAPASVWALEPWRVAELVLPGLVRGADPVMDHVFGELAGPGKWPAGDLPIPFSASVAVGLLPVALAGAGLRGGRLGRLLGLAGLALLWVALGPALGADRVLGHVPVWGGFRYSEKLVGPLTLVLAVLAARGLDAVVERRVDGRWLLVGAIAAGLAAVGASLAAVHGLPADLAPEGRERVVRGGLHAFASAVALGGWLLWRSRARMGAQGVALALLAWAGLMVASPAALHAGDPEARLRSPGPALVAEPPGPRILTPYTYEPLTTGAGSDWIDQEGREQEALAYPSHNVRMRLDSLTSYDPMLPRRLEELEVTFGPRWAAAARRYAVTHVVADAPRSEPHASLLAIATAGGRRVEGTAWGEAWAVPHRPWASFAPAVELVGSGQAALEATASAFARESAAVVVEAWGAFGVSPGRVLGIERGLEALRVEAEADGEATLVIADAWWPGWEATIDGQPVTIFRADAFVRAVRWPPGRHVLEMRYRPPEVRSGLAVSSLGVALLAGAAALLRRRAASASPTRRTAPSAESASPELSSGGS